MLQEELGFAADNSLYKGIPVGGLFGDGLAEGERVAARLMVCEIQMVSGYRCWSALAWQAIKPQVARTSNGRSASTYGLNCAGGCAVFQLRLP